MRNRSKTDINILAGYIILLLVATASSIAGVYIIKIVQKTRAPTVVRLEEEPSQFPDYYAIKGETPDPKIRAAKITVDCLPDGCKNDRPATTDFDGIKKRYRVKGEFARAYLYIEALVDYERPLTTWDDFYFSLSGFGGHLISEESSLSVPSSGSSRYLYDLRSISYYPTIKDKEKKINKKSNVNFFNFLQDGLIVDVLATISSNRPGRIMKEVTIYYECFENSDCGIEEIKGESIGF